MLDALLQDPKLGRLTKSEQDLVLSFVEALGKRSAGGPGGTSRVLKEIAERERLRRDASGRDRYVSSELTDLSIAYLQDQGAFMVGSMGVKGVKLPTGKFRIWDRGDYFRDDAQPRAPATKAGRGRAAISRGDYSCERWAWAHPIDDETLMFDVVDDPRAQALALVTQKLLIRRDKMVIAELWITGTWGTDKDGVAGAPGAGQFQQWDQAASTPRKNLHTYSLEIHERTGFWPNVLQLNAKVLSALLLHADVVGAFQYTTAGAVPTMEALARALFSLVEGVTPPTITVAGGIETTSAKGLATTTAYIGGKHALLAYVDANPGLQRPTAFSIFSLENPEWGTNGQGVRIRDYEEPDIAVPHTIEGELYMDPKRTATELGAFLENAVA